VFGHSFSLSDFRRVDNFSALFGSFREKRVDWFSSQSAQKSLDFHLQHEVHFFRKF